MQKYLVSFAVKAIEKSDPRCGLLVERVRDFPTLRAAASFSRSLRVLLGTKEQLIGKPCIEEAA